ncbi:putative transposase [Theobroma cacao]|nr:putative transposase [Theobroma cacao]
MLSEEKNKVMTEAKTNNIKDCKSMSREWIMNEIWDLLIDMVWGTEEWQDKSRKARQNRLTAKKESIPKHTGGSIPFVVHAKRMEMYNFVLSQKYGEGSSSQPELYPNAWTEAIGGIETTRTHVFGTQVPATALLTGTHNNVATSESACGPMPENTTSPATALEEKVENLSENLGKIREEICEEIKNAMAENMSEFMAGMESVIMTNALSKQGNAGPSS